VTKNLYIIGLLVGLYSQAQPALYNSGNIRIHDQGQLGFHTDLINDAAFDENVGLVGFYGNNRIFVSGAFAPTFFDTEFAAANGVFLQTGINNSNNTNFVFGDILTPRNLSDSYYNFLQNAFYGGDSDISKVDGYAAISQQQNFTFPVGDSQQLRPLILISASANPLAKCAYYFEDPNSPTSLNTSFDTTRKARDIGFVSTTEFWRLEGSIPSTISISWNERSAMAALTDDIANILIVGWSKSSNQWMILGTTAAVGDLSQGFVSSESFVPDDYDAITFGTIDVPAEFLALDNFLVSANGDGINDSFSIPELEQSPNNHLKIYNRFGQLVFDQVNYTNQFNGFSNVDNLVINREQGLPSGVYFYIVSMEDLGLDFQGFLYLTR
jgi:gliding motility-associated-like protein